MFKRDDQQELRERFEAEAMPHSRHLFNLAYHFTRNTDKAADLVQDTYLKAYKDFRRYNPDTNIRAWLAKIMTNMFYNAAKRARLEEQYFAAGYDISETAETLADPDTTGDFAGLPQDAGFHDEVKKALDSLPEEMRIPVLLADLLDYRYGEIAQIIDRPIGTVMSRLHRGRSLLKQQLEDYARRQGIVKQTQDDDTEARVVKMKRAESKG